MSRRITRLWGCAGLDVVVVEDPAEVDKHLEGAGLLGADAFDGPLMVQSLKKHANLRGVLWTAEPIDRVLRYVENEPRISSVFGRPNFESTPRDAELLMVARRLARPSEPGIPFSSYLLWGFSGYEETIRDTAGRDAAVARVQKFIEKIGVPKRVGEMLGELAHELLMNALYDAPVDPEGRHKYAQDRKASITVEEHEAATLRLASDGVLVAIQVVDPFGRLERRHVFTGLARGLKGGQMDQSHGGAGLGMVVCHNSTVAMIYDVLPNKRTEVTGLFDLDLNLREFRTQAKSLHFFQRDGRSG
ncbi:MAG: hypothetical protein HY698_16650 [Deltaproteobacteria bacterium]|nr:hypothetical protein [Deltaproteobacteria bacterium]